MKFFFKYISQYKTFFIVFFAGAVFFSVTFYLYHIPVMAVIYPAVVCVFFSLLVFAVRFNAEKKRHKYLQDLKNCVPELPATLPSRTICENDFAELLHILSANIAELNTQKDAQYADMQDYYSLWVHQVKTPITAMKLMLQNGNSASSARLQADLPRDLRRELHRIEQYVDMALTFIRLESETTDYVIKEYELDSIIKNAVRSFASEFISRHLRLIYNECGKKIVTDTKWFSFVLEQVLSNALKYTSEGSVSIFVENDDTLCIRDTGIGINPEDLPRVFENSYTGRNGRGESHSSGIGLYLCRRICHNLNHSIEVESRPNEGTTVRIGFGRAAERLE
ncbi:MAG: sensor histidine kinase [Treponemataceae bacterium]|nr:sensor histidine kinase [Treponemataceae bacterium]